MGGPRGHSDLDQSRRRHLLCGCQIKALTAQSDLRRQGAPQTQQAQLFGAVAGGDLGQGPVLNARCGQARLIGGAGRGDAADRYPDSS